MKIGDCVHIGNNSIIECAQIGNLVEIGKNCVIVGPSSLFTLKILIACWSQGRFVIIKDCAKISDGSIVAPGTVIPSMAVYDGSSPAQQVDELPETWPELMEAQSFVFFVATLESKRLMVQIWPAVSRYSTISRLHSLADPCT